MNHRAKMTYCIPQMMNVYENGKAYVCKDAKDTYIEVNTQEEAELIEEINDHFQQALQLYKQLIKLQEK